MSTREANAFSSTSSSPRMPGARRSDGPGSTSSTKRNFAAIVNTTPAASAAATIVDRARRVDRERLLAQHVQPALDRLQHDLGMGRRRRADQAPRRRPRLRAARGATGTRCRAPASASALAARPRTSATAVIRAPLSSSNTRTYDCAIPPAPMSPIRDRRPHARSSFPFDQLRGGGADRVAEELDVLRLVALVPRKHEDAIQERVRAGEPLGR